MRAINIDDEAALEAATDCTLDARCPTLQTVHRAVNITLAATLAVSFNRPENAKCCLLLPYTQLHTLQPTHIFHLQECDLECSIIARRS